MENSRHKEENIIEDVRNLFRLKKLKTETIDTTVKDIENLFRLKKQNKAIKDISFRNIRNIVENEEEENYYKPVKVSNFWSNNYLEKERYGDINKTLLVKE